jgi:hypothetical protein
MPNLAARYRRLLLTYPRSWRRAHGAELVTTLLDAAPPDRTRPTRAEALGLLWGGIRIRCRVRGTGTACAAILTSVCTAVAVAALGGFLGWQTAPALPSDAEATRLALPALIPGRDTHPQRWDFVFSGDPLDVDSPSSFWLHGTDEYEAGRVYFDIWYPGGAEATTAADVAAARQRLRDAGWRLSANAAHRDGHRIEIVATYGTGTSTPVMRVSVMRNRPAAVLPLTTAGLVAGALTGWLLVAAAWRRTLRVAPSRRDTTKLLYTVGVLAILPATTMSAAALTLSYLHTDEAVPAWVGYTFTGWHALAWAGLLLLLTAWLTTLRKPEGSQRQTDRPSTRHPNLDPYPG